MEPKAIYRLECDSLERPITEVGYFFEFMKKAKELAVYFSDIVVIKQFIVEVEEWITMLVVEP